MESSRRPFDRSREPGTKKPRLTDEVERGPNPGTRPFPQRQVPSGVTTTLASARFRTNDRDSESGDSGRGGGYQPQPPPHQELVTQYKTALAELTFNSKPIITNLTIIAGENQYAAKAISATVCANILEVPSEQKLPSLYLLDSIVKNIGRDYIKYFAARLPEVFCKAYRQVDPSVHSSMRHLFGTWKGVFPPQTLQMIEKELGFTPAVNGSASASATARSNSQSQRPPHSIHVNPKYLERQRLQQSSQTKGLINDMTGAISNSNEDPERPDRPLGAARPWLDPRVNIHSNQRTHRDAYNDSVPEKSIGGSFGGNEYTTAISINLGSVTGRTGGRVSELGNDKTWYKAGGGIAETMSGQRNGFGLKHGFPNNELSKSMNLNAHHQPTQNISSIRSSLNSSNWKNSEEEEFMWDEMNSGSTGHGAPSLSNDLRKEPWTTDDENLEVGDHLQTPHHFEGQPSLSWKLPEQHSIDKLKPGQSEGFVSSIGGLPIHTNSSAARIGNRSFMPNVTIGLADIVGQQQSDSVGDESPSGLSPLQQQPPSPPVTMRHPNPIRNLAVQDRPQTLKTSHLLGGLHSQYIKDSSPDLTLNSQVGNFRRTQLKDLSGPFSSVTSFQPRHHQQLGSLQNEITVKTKKPQSIVSLARETSEQSTTSMSAAAMKGGILSNNSKSSSLPTKNNRDTRNISSPIGVQPAWSGGPSPTSLISSGSLVSSPSSLDTPNDDSSTLLKLPEGKAGEPPRASTQLPASSNASSASAQTSNTTNPIANLLSSLVAKGLISAETESPSKVPTEMLIQLEDQSESITTSSSLPVASVSGSAGVLPSSRDKVDDTAKTSSVLSKSSNTETRNLIGFEFKPDVIRELHSPVIRELLDDLPLHCTVCGLRLKHDVQFNRHMGWHATREREENGLIRASRWYARSIDWIAGKAESTSDNAFTNSVDIYGKTTDRSQLDNMVEADENQCLCVLCGELFEDVYCLERDEWMFNGAVYVADSDSNNETGILNIKPLRGPIVHARCLPENLISTDTKMEQD